MNTPFTTLPGCTLGTPEIEHIMSLTLVNTSGVMNEPAAPCVTPVVTRRSLFSHDIIELIDA
jgi:hypothetical protein